MVETRDILQAVAAAEREAAGEPPEGEATVDLAPTTPDPRRDRIAQVVARVMFGRDAHYRQARRLGLINHFPTTDHLFVSQDEPHEPEPVFHRLRWGGQVIFIGRDDLYALQLARRYQQHGGYVVEHGPLSVRVTPRWLPLPLLGRRVPCFVARRVALLPPGATSDRFTFDVRLAARKPPEGGYVVLKRVPPYYRIVQRLRDRFPDASPDVLLTRAEKLVERVFPVFLTREAAFLQMLHRDLSEPYRRRVPMALGVRKGPDGLVRTLYMNWMRLAHQPMEHLRFARQSADLLRALHDEARIIHLDLRLDNFVITDEGVGFVDFGSAVRVGENLHESPMLRSIFDEMMTTSQIQVTLGRMKDSGRLTSDLILNAYQKVDKAVDLFYLAVQLTRPHTNPDLRNLILYDKHSEEARRISRLADAILRPKNRLRPSFISARDIHNGLARIEQMLQRP